MRILLFGLIIILLSAPLCAQQSGAGLIAASIKFHDPQNKWPQTQATFIFSDTRPGKEDRTGVMYLNNPAGVLCFRREQDGRQVTCHVVNNTCTYEVDGNAPDANVKEQFKLTDNRALMLRNYYLYLWGLPMKLKDPGTVVDDKVYQKKFNGRQTLAARVTYAAEVGSDTWYFYFDPQSYEMIGYQFFHDEDKGDGEYILLSGLEDVNGMKIPKSRTWYTNPDSTLLGTDNLIGVKPLTHLH